LLPRLLLDTHIVVHWLIGVKKLSRDQFRAINSASERKQAVGVSAISLMEISMMSITGRLEAPLPDFLASIEADPLFQIMPLTIEIASEIPYLSALRDPSDMAIAATARVHQLVLVTSDERIIESQLVKTIA
jgi:PIN domain nuclease of toxin-antitoxin system